MYWHQFPGWAFFKIRWVTEMGLVAGRVSYASNMGHFNLVTNVQRTIHDLLSFTWVSVIFVMEAKISVAAPAHLLA